MNEWEWPQYVMAGFFVTGIIIHVSRHGDHRDPFNGPAQAFSAALWAWVLYMGGFWG